MQNKPNRSADSSLTDRALRACLALVTLAYLAYRAHQFFGPK